MKNMEVMEIDIAQMVGRIKYIMNHLKLGEDTYGKYLKIKSEILLIFLLTMEKGKRNS